MCNPSCPLVSYSYSLYIIALKHDIVFFNISQPLVLMKKLAIPTFFQVLYC